MNTPPFLRIGGCGLAGLPTMGGCGLGETYGGAVWDGEGTGAAGLETNCAGTSPQDGI